MKHTLLLPEIKNYQEFSKDQNCDEKQEEENLSDSNVQVEEFLTDLLSDECFHLRACLKTIG